MNFSLFRIEFLIEVIIRENDRNTSVIIITKINKAVNTQRRIKA